MKITDLTRIIVSECVVRRVRATSFVSKDGVFVHTEKFRAYNKWAAPLNQRTRQLEYQLTNTRGQDKLNKKRLQ